MDIEPEIIIEKSDGEITDSEVDYIPLERPAFLHSEKVNSSRVVDYATDDDAESDASSDSDSDTAYRAKKLKMRKLISKRATTNQKLNKYNVWTSKIQEDILAETLVSCDVTKMDRSRTVETYDYPVRSFDGNKRRYDDRRNVHLRLGKREYPNETTKKGPSRFILDLTVTSTNTNEEVAIDIANKLCEEKDELLKRLVTFAGKERAIHLFNETKKIEEDGGMLIMNQTRRRTPGGVYFFLVKRDDIITEEQKKQIFVEDKQKRKVKKNVRKPTYCRDDLPILLSRAEAEIAKGHRTRKESEHTENVSNPPPSPVTDGKEVSSDEMTDIPDVVPPKTAQDVSRNVDSYRSEYSEIECSADMDHQSTPHANDSKEISSDEMVGIPDIVPPKNNSQAASRNLQSYEDDFLEIGCGADMDFFT